MNSSLTRPLAVVTGTSNGIGYELAVTAEQNRKLNEPGSANK
ncbi:hypothetical protein [Coleofasciculus sp. H7-2]